jgi:hypothetical protein
MLPGPTVPAKPCVADSRSDQRGSRSEFEILYPEHSRNQVPSGKEFRLWHVEVLCWAPAASTSRTSKKSFLFPDSCGSRQPRTPVLPNAVCRPGAPVTTPITQPSRLWTPGHLYTANADDAGPWRRPAASAAGMLDPLSTAAMECHSALLTRKRFSSVPDDASAGIRTNDPYSCFRRLNALSSSGCELGRGVARPYSMNRSHPAQVRRDSLTVVKDR